MKKSKIYIYIFLWAFIMGAIFPQIPVAYAKELRLAHMFPVGAPSDKHIKRWADKVASDSNGKLTIRIFPSNTLITAPEMYDGVVKGAADLGFAWRYKPTNYTVGVLFPFLLTAPDTYTAGKVYEDIWKKFPEMMAEEWKDVKPLYLEPTMPVYLFSRKPIRNMDDMKGQQIRVPSQELGSMIKALGGTPAFMSTADFIVGLDKGTVDGGTGLFAIIPDFKLGGKIKSVVNISLGNSTPLMLIMNKKAYNDLPADLQSILEKSMEWAKEDSKKYWAGFYDDCVKYSKENGIELVNFAPEEKAKWMAIINQVRRDAGKDLDKKGYPGTELIQFIDERIDFYAKK